MPSRLLLNELTREEARSIAPDTLLVFPVGATEQHGPHLPVGTDHLTVEHIARAAAAEIAASVPVVVAPTMPFGSSHHHLPFGGTMSLSTENYFRANLCFSGSQAPFSWLLRTDCWMKYIPSTPSFTLG